MNNKILLDVAYKIKTGKGGLGSSLTWEECFELDELIRFRTCKAQSLELKVKSMETDLDLLQATFDQRDREADDFEKRVIAAEAKCQNLHKVIAKQQLKITEQAKSISNLLTLYTTSKKSRKHQKTAEKYSNLKEAYKSLKEQTCTKN